MVCCREKPSGAGLWFSCCNEYPWTAVPKWPGLLHWWRSWVIQFIFVALNELKWEHNLAWSFSLMLLIVKPRIIDAFSTMLKITSHSKSGCWIPSSAWSFYQIYPGWDFIRFCLDGQCDFIWCFLYLLLLSTASIHTLPLTLGMGWQGRRIMEWQDDLCGKGPLAVIQSHTPAMCRDTFTRSEPCLCWPWTFPGVQHPPLLWAAYCSNNVSTGDYWAEEFHHKSVLVTKLAACIAAGYLQQPCLCCQACSCWP